MYMFWDTAKFFVLWFGLFVVLPICIYLALRYLLSGKLRRTVINVAAIAGILVAFYMIAFPFLYPPTHSGGLGILILVPLGALLGAVCSGLMWINSRTKRG